MTIYAIPDHRLDRLTDAIDRLNKLAGKLGTPPAVYTVLGDRHVKHTDGTYTRYFTVDVIGDEPPALNGWSFVAQLTHTPAGNLIKGGAVPERYRDSAPDCDHCHTARRRNVTYILTDGPYYKQVGSSCLVDFLGHPSAESIAAWYELAADLRDLETDPDDMEPGGFHSGKRYIDLAGYLAVVAACIDRYGWTSRVNADDRHAATADTALIDMLDPTSPAPSPSNRDEAQAAIGWALTVDPSGSDYLHNLRVIAQNGFIDFKSAGYAASMITAYRKAIEADRPAPQPGQHVGTIGQRQAFTVTVESARPMPARSYGGRAVSSTLYTLRDADGNTLIWFCSGDCELAIGQTYHITGTVDGHDVYRGVNQTKITRCKVA